MAELKATSNKNRIVWIELLRIVSVFMVIMLHVSSRWFRSLDITSPQWAVSGVYFMVGRLGVGCFTMISGALLLSSDKSDSLKYIFRHILHFAVIFLVWSALYDAESVIISAHAGKSLSITKIINSFVFGRTHLWYLYMIAAMYLITPLLRKIVAHKTLCIYFIVLCIVFSYLPNMLMTTAPGAYKIYSTLMNEKLHLHMIIGYAGYYITGYYIVHYGLTAKQRKAAYAAGLAGIVFASAGVILFSRYAGSQNDFNNNLTVSIYMFCTAVFVFFKYAAGNSAFVQKHSKQIVYIGGCTFGIYLVHLMIHDFLLTKLFRLFPDCLYVITIPIITIIVFMLSFGVVAVMKIIPGIRRIVT